jgi:hypothetical protein
LAQVPAEPGMQWNAIVGFIDMFYLSWLRRQNSTRKSLKLVARCVAAIFEVSSAFPRQAGSYFEKILLIDQKAAFMWAIFQTHRIIQSFISVQFRAIQLSLKSYLFMVTELIRRWEELGASARKRKETPPRPARTLKAN